MSRSNGGSGRKAGPPRSVVFDLFGEYVRRDHGVISLNALSRLLACFDVPNDSARVLMSRLRREGWFEAVRKGRASFYTPSTRGWELLDEGLERIMNRPRQTWSGEWRIVIVSIPEKQRAARAHIRKRLGWLGFGHLAPSTWVSPHDRLGEAEEMLAGQPSARYELMIARSLHAVDDRKRAERAWDVASLARDYRTYVKDWERNLNALTTKAVSPRRVLIMRTRAIHEYRLFLFRDPNLPVELLPPDWPGWRAHEMMLQVFETLREPAMSFYSEVVREGPPVPESLTTGPG